MQNLFQNAPVAAVLFSLIIIISLLAFNRNSRLYEKFILHPYSLVRGRRVYSLVMHAFIHADYGHLIFNMITFFFFAFELEMVIGHLNFAIIFFGSLLISVIPALYQHRNDEGYRSLGASGAVSGVIFSAILYNPASKIYIFLIPIGIPSPIFALLFVGYSYFASKNRYDNVAHESHLWGAIGGTLLTIALDPAVLPEFFSKIF